MFKINKVKLIILVLFFIAFSRVLNAQDKDKELHIPRFDYEVASFPGKSADKSRTEMYIWVRNTHLQYIAEDTLYSARYQINLGVSDEKGQSILTRDETFRVTEIKYSTTIDPGVKEVQHFEFLLTPGDYTFKIRLLDLNSNRFRIQQREKKIRAFKLNQLEVSDVLFLNVASSDSIKPENILPSVRLPIQEKIFVYSEIVSSADKNELKIESTLLQKEGKEGFRFSQNIVPKNEITKILLEVNKESMFSGQNQLLLRVTENNQSKAIRKDVQFVSGGMEISTDLSIDDKIAPLMYVTNGDDWKKLQNASDEDREELFNEFWAKRDPNPGSPENELFNEFYKRVESANRNFSFSRKDGWKTDRGRVFIVFGPPDRIEQSTPSRYSQGNYEVWYYEDLREKFVFYDQYGFGEFRLVSGNVRPAAY